MTKKIFYSIVMCIAVCVFSQTAYAANIATDNITDYSIQVAKMLKSTDRLKTQAVELNIDESLYIIGQSNNDVSNMNFYGMCGCVTGPDNRFVLAFDNYENLIDALTILKCDEDIIYVQQDCIVELQEDNLDGKEIFDAEEKELSWGKSALKLSGYVDYLMSKNDADDVIVAVVDSGISDIDYLSEKLVSGYDFVKNTSDATVDIHPQSHGTFLSSIIADCTNGLGIYIMPVRVMAYSTGSLINVVNGILYSADNGADVINVSIGGRISDCVALDDAVAYADSMGSIVVVSAGNEGLDTEGYCPSHNQSAVTVSSVDEELKFASGFSNYGDAIDFTAPGVNINGYNAKGKVTTLSGTSMSAAYISACFALLKYGNKYSENDRLIACLEKYSLDLGVPGWDMQYGCGIPQMDLYITDDEYEENDDVIEVIPTVNEVVIISMPFNVKYKYKSDGIPVLDGMVVMVIYSDDTYRFIDDFSEFVIEQKVNTSKVGKSLFMLSYNDIIVECEVEVYYTWWQFIIYYILGGWLWNHILF